MNNVNLQTLSQLPGFEEILNEFMFEVVNKENIYFFEYKLRELLNRLRFYNYKDLKIISQEDSPENINISISKELSREIEVFEKLNPEYFI